MRLLKSTITAFCLILASPPLWAEPSEAQKAEWRARREAMGGEAPSEAQRAEWRARREAREAAAGVAPAPAVDVPEKAKMPPAMAAHQHAMPGAAPSGQPVANAAGKMAEGAAPGKPASAGGPPEAASGRPAGMAMRGGSGPLWLADSPPSRGDAPARGGMLGMGGMGGMNMGGPRNGPPSKRLWLRAGSDPQKSGFAREDAEAPTEVVLVRPQGAPAGEVLPPGEDGKRNLSFEMPVQGFYRLYATSRKLQGDTLNVSVAKAEIANFSHGGDEEERAQGMAAQRVLESAPIEIVRERAADEKMFFQLKSGDEQAYLVLQKGLPVQGARVRFVSYEGWSKEVLSDEQGRVVFRVVRDYFPAWEEFRKRFKASYLIIAEANAAEKGTYKEQPYSNVRYQATLAGSYYPSPADYRSYAWGLGIGLLIVLFGGTAVYLYRRRRVKPYREVHFDDGR